MKIRSILLMAIIVLLHFSAKSQQKVLFATSEEEMYQLFDQMLDSARMSNKCIYPEPLMQERFGIGFFENFYGIDTIIIFEQNRHFAHFYNAYLSCEMPIDFYERIFNYFENIDTKENYCIKFSFLSQYTVIKDMLIKRYESGILNKKDNIGILEVIEQGILGSIIRDHYYAVMLRTDDRYITDKIRNALIDVIEHPFYPTEYYDIFMSYQDTVHLDTTGIPDTVKVKYRKNPAFYNFSPEEHSYYKRLNSFFIYEKKGKKQGLSPGQAYLKQVGEEWFKDKGYLQINDIAEYAHKKQDKLLIKHLKEFKKKYPDYPLKYF